MSRILLDVIADESLVPELVNSIVQYQNTVPILLLSGDLGAGKTTLAKELFRRIGVIDEVNSPSFNIVNTYLTKDGQSVYHFDLYRIKHPLELEELGFEEYLDHPGACLIEWPEIAMNYLNEPYLKLSIEHLDSKRHYVLELFE